ncbi:MAG: DSD1 family PLP-dependent enzyme [Candidatus Bathyarchaeota archaeon]|nr:MAG: DSD1 family PLP-dependent enzyme [Candidatus Bathyarchaeota archaeon]
MYPIGANKNELETPTLLLDLDVLEQNIKDMADYFSNRPASLRPHAKTHKTPIIAHKQLQAGAIGVCCQKLEEAEVMNAYGINSILITNQIVDPRKIRKLVAMSHHGEVIVALDNLVVAKRTSDIALANQIKQDVVVEVNVGINRCGVEPGKSTLAFTRALLDLEGLNFRGLLGYEGPFFNLTNFEERKQATQARNQLLVQTKELLEDASIDVDIVSGGATGTYNITGNYPGITEVEAGSYVFMDTTYTKLEEMRFKCALTLLTTVISRPTSQRAVIEAGMKSITSEFGMPIVQGHPGAELQRLSEEHGILKLTDPNTTLKVGDTLELLPSHCCTTVNLHDHYYCIRNDELESVWTIMGRGKTR